MVYHAIARREEDSWTLAAVTKKPTGEVVGPGCP